MNNRESSWGARLFVGLQHVLPQHLLSLLMYRLARIEWAPLKNLMIRAYVRLVGVDLRAAAQPELTAYPHLNAFFTRALRPDARPLDPDPRAVLSPVDGTISQIGSITDGRIIQAKGIDYSVRDLLGGQQEANHVFDGGRFATIYLSPRDYHRIHMPLAGELAEMTYVGGRLFSVNQVTAALVPGLFARNERVLCLFGTDLGPVAVVLVGAIFVGGIETVWEGEVTPALPGLRSRRWQYTGSTARVRLDRGEELGRFNLGSTVILLFPADTLTWAPSLVPGQPVRLGQRIGTYN
ncbi:archaetidylserine decarboxylase [uncultured Lamprocystis sp.]|jgi:phosphatidylserine decarboxylase|uniref:archaetidylserine decarboxylase n=1 Tax=uncultured Lamprocystis sp. TaxID=543132 RepID=UPI0025F29454|nr:archaetidylserine decarboxylase [uncultured Lamprocystis sp.]